MGIFWIVWGMRVHRTSAFEAWHKLILRVKLPILYMEISLIFSTMLTQSTHPSIHSVDSIIIIAWILPIIIDIGSLLLILLFNIFLEQIIMYFINDFLFMPSLFFQHLKILFIMHWFFHHELLLFFVFFRVKESIRCKIQFILGIDIDLLGG